MDATRQLVKNNEKTYITGFCSFPIIGGETALWNKINICGSERTFAQNSPLLDFWNSLTNREQQLFF